jgi:type IV secretory pathway ATPase VirB11/archaellum biosynthesis ATPase
MDEKGKGVDIPGLDKQGDAKTGEYTYDENKMRLRINCLGCIYGASIEDYDHCMARAIDYILETKKVSSLVLAKEREYEYDFDQVKMLLEIAKVLEDVVREKIISFRNLGSDKCKSLYPKWSSWLQYIVFDVMRRDPIGAYVEILREIRRTKIKMKNATDKNHYDGYSNFMENGLEFIRDRLDKTKLIYAAKPYLAGYHVGDRSLYRQLFTPNVRPNFMLTKYIMTPPEGGRSVDRYKIGDTKIEIFRMPYSTEHFYYALPPEFRLSDEHYAILDAARHYMATHRPKTNEFVKSERVREVFFNIGRDMIRDMSDKAGINLSTEDVEQLATILTRYTSGMGVLEILLADEKVQDVYINSPIERQPILINHQDWEECKTNLIPTTEDAEAWATRLRIQSGRPLDEANPVLDADMDVPGGKARFAVITRSLSPEGLGFAIRRHRDKPWTLPLFIKSKALTPLAAGLLSFLVDGSVSMLVAGGRGAGKTSILSSLMLEIMPKTRIVTIEDTLELPVSQMRELNYNIEQLKSRSVITRVETEMPADEALRTALRLGDSALILGEVRSLEAKALYEAMRVGALSNIVAGTIHGESAYGVFDRVVNDLGVPPTSFKATDIIPICKSLRSSDGLHRFRRMTEITEVRKKWDVDPVKEGGFMNLMEYSGKEDTLKPTDTLVNGESEVLNRIASHVKEWSGNWEVVWENINMRAKMKKVLVDLAEQTGNANLLEAEWVVRSNIKFHLIEEDVRKEIGYGSPSRVYEEWLKWLKTDVKKSSLRR